MCTQARHSADRFAGVQLCQRPLNGVLSKPNYNNDYIAPKFRDHLMPARHAPPLAFPHDVDVESASAQRPSSLEAAASLSATMACRIVAVCLKQLC